MKKKLLLAAGAMLTAAAVSAFVYVNNERNSMSDLFNANVEALANGEGSGNYTCETDLKMGDGNTFFCGSCDWVSGAEPAFWSRTRSCTK